MDGEVAATNSVEPSRWASAVNWTGIALFLVLAFGLVPMIIFAIWLAATGRLKAEL